MARIHIAVCAGRTVEGEFLDQLPKLRGAALTIVRGLHIHQNRNVAARALVENDDSWDYLVFLDTDMILPDDFLERIQSYDDPVVGGLYFRRRVPENTPIPGFWAPEGAPAYKPLSTDEVKACVEKPGLYPIDVLGTGCMAIHRDVLSGWGDEPMFDTRLVNRGVDVISEDVWFCQQAAERGVPLFLDSSLVLGHLGSVVVDPGFYLANAETIAPSLLTSESLHGK